MPETAGLLGRPPIHPASNRKCSVSDVLVSILPILACGGPLLPGIGHIFAFRVVTLLFVLLTLARQHTSPTPPLFSVPALVIAVFILAQITFSKDLSLYTQVATPVIFGIALVLSMEKLSVADRTFKMLQIGWVVALVASALIGTREAITGRHLSNYLTSSDALSRVDPRLIAGTFGNPNTFAAFLVVSLPLMLGTTSAHRSNIVRLGGLLMGAWTVGLVILTGSRTGMVTCAAAVVLFLVLMGARRAALGGSAALILFGILKISLGSTFRSLTPDKAFSFFTDLTSGSLSQGTSADTRLDLYKNGLWMVQKSWGLGMGPGMFQWTSTYVDVPFNTAGVYSPHNAFIEIAVDISVPALIAILYWAFRCFRTFIRARRSGGSHQQMIAAGALISMLTVIPMALDTSSFLVSSVNWMWIATISSYARYFSLQSSPEPIDAAAHAQHLGISATARHPASIAPTHQRTAI